MLAALAAGMLNGRETVQAQPPRAYGQYDLEASGFVMPASGVAPEGAYVPPVGAGVMQAGGPMAAAMSPTAAAMSPTAAAGGSGMPMPSMGGHVMPVGFFSGGPACDAGPMACGGCDGGCSMGGGCGPDGSCGCPMKSMLQGGVLGKMMHGDSGCGCGSCGGGRSGSLSGMRHMCLFCRGQGCSACQLWSPGSLIGMIGALRPYSEQGKCAQRWYDVSAEAMFLGHTNSAFGGDNGLIATQGVAGTPALSLSDSNIGDIEAGVRLSLSMIFGPGGNIELTYIGGQEWSDTVSTALVPTETQLVIGATETFVEVTNPGDLFYSFISEFGTDPAASTSDVGTPGSPVSLFDPGGFDDTDAAEQQSFSIDTRFHSGEVNYRRRVVGPYCRFQGSWLFGLRYVRFDQDFDYNVLSNNLTSVGSTPQFFTSSNSVKNDLYGGQLGGDLWYNVMPGINFGVAGKVGWMNNNIDQTLSGESNSVSAGSLSRSDEDVTVLGEVEMSLLYRLTHSFTFKSSYYLLAIDDLAAAGLDADATLAFAESTAVSAAPIQFDSLVIQGFSFGGEYTW